MSLDRAFASIAATALLADFLVSVYSHLGFLAVMVPAVGQVWNLRGGRLLLVS